MPEKLLTVKEVAEWLSVSDRTVYNLIDRGHLQSIRIGKVVRFSPDAVREYLNRSSDKPPIERSDEP